MQEKKIDSEAYRVVLDGRWRLEDLYEFPHAFYQCYAFTYCLDSELSPRDRERINDAFVGYPWRGGYSYVNIYTVLQNQVPLEDRPTIKSISYASPGWLDIFLNVDVAIQVAKSVGILAGSAVAAAKAYTTCMKYLAQVAVDRKRAQLQEMQLREKENDFLKAVEKNEVRDLKQLVIKLTKEQMKSSISEERLIQLIKETNKDYKELPVNINSSNPTYPILIIWLSDLHIGAYNAKYSSFVTLPNYDKEEIKARLTKIVQTFAGQSYGAVYVVNLGDSIDGYNKETTRGGHQLPEVMDDKEISETYIECMMEFFKALKANIKSDEFNYLCIGESNHDGNWGWLNNKLLAAYLANEGVKSFISNFPIDHFNTVVFRIY